MSKSFSEIENSHYVERTASTNALLTELVLEEERPEGFMVYSDYQSAGRGQQGNSWEGEKGKNLLFSIVLYPQAIKPEESFLLSQMISLAIKQSLDKYTDGIVVKWPNDIYWKQRKIAGILIENAFKGEGISHSIIGVGLNINQENFMSSAHNPVSLAQITGKTQDRAAILADIRKNLLDIYHDYSTETIRTAYMQMLYRREGLHSFAANEQKFEAEILDIKTDGQLELLTKEGEKRCFYFKELEFLQ